MTEKKNGFVLSVRYFLPVLLVLSCFKFGDDVSSDECLSAISSKTISFAADIAPILASDCSSSCHQGTSAPQLNYRAASGLTGPASCTTGQACLQAMYVTGNDPQSIGLIQRLKGSTGSMPPTGKLTICDVTRFEKWQTDGYLP